MAYLTYEVCVYLAIKESSQVARVLESEETARWFRACLPWLLCGMCDPSQPVQILAGFCRGLLRTSNERDHGGESLAWVGGHAG